MDFKVNNCNAEVYLNGIPIRRYKAVAQAVSVPVLANLVEGANTLELIVNPGSTPSRAREGAELCDNKPHVQTRGFAEAKVVIYPENVYPGDPAGVILAELSLDALSGAEEKPRYVRATFSLDNKQAPNLRRWAWQDAEKIDLKREHKAIMDVVETSWTAMKTGNYSQKDFDLQYIQAMEGYYESPAMGAPEAGRARTKRIYRERAAEPDWAMEPLDPERFDFRLCADGRLVEIIDKDWQATVRSVPLDDYGGPEGKGACDYPMMLGKIKGKFHILR